MLKEFNTLEDLQRNFNNTLVEYEGVVYLAKPRDDLKLGLYKYREDMEQWAVRSTKLIDFNGNNKDAKLLCPRLGFFMYGGWLYYVIRTARRQYQFGANKNNITGFYWPEIGSVYRKSYADFENFFLYSKEVVSQYKTRNNFFDPNKKIQVLSPDFAVLGNKLLYQANEIGTMGKPGEFIIDPECYDSLLVRQLEKHGVTVR